MTWPSAKSVPHINSLLQATGLQITPLLYDVPVTSTTGEVSGPFKLMVLPCSKPFGKQEILKDTHPIVVCVYCCSLKAQIQGQNLIIKVEQIEKKKDKEYDQLPFAIWKSQTEASYQDTRLKLYSGFLRSQAMFIATAYKIVVSGFNIYLYESLSWKTAKCFYSKNT